MLPAAILLASLRVKLQLSSSCNKFFNIYSCSVLSLVEIWECRKGQFYVSQAQDRPYLTPAVKYLNGHQIVGCVTMDPVPKIGHGKWGPGHR